MIEFNLIWLIIVLVNVISFVLMIVTSLINGGKKDKGFSFTNYFPYENYSYITRVFSILYAISLFASLATILPFVGDLKENSILPIITTFIIGCSGIAIVLTYLIPLKYEKEHLIISTVLMSLTFLSLALASTRQILAYSMLNRFSEGGYHLILGIIGVLFTLLMGVIIFNPKLKNWANLEEHLKGDEKYYIRPKFFPLAYSEWSAIGLSLVAQILFLTSLIN